MRLSHCRLVDHGSISGPCPTALRLLDCADYRFALIVTHVKLIIHAMHAPTESVLPFGVQPKPIHVEPNVNREGLNGSPEAKKDTSARDLPAARWFVRGGRTD